jgi:outer membrane receptor protein involved in Fe transport
VTVALVAPGTLYFDRWNQLDFSVKRPITFGKKYTLTPSFELYNVTNSSVVVNALQTYGATFLRPTSTLPGRLMRLGAQFKF